MVEKYQSDFKTVIIYLVGNYISFGSSFITNVFIFEKVFIGHLICISHCSRHLAYELEIPVCVCDFCIA